MVVHVLRSHSKNSLLYKPNHGAVLGETGSAGRRGTSRSPSDQRMETDRRPPSSLIPPPPLFDAGIEHSYTSTEAAASPSSNASPIADPDRRQSRRGSLVVSPSLEVDVFADAIDEVSLQKTKVAAVDPPDLSEELRDRIVRQVEYYFSEENLATDRFLLRFIKKDKEGYVPIEVIASFRKTKKLTKTLCVIEAALRTSSQLVVSEDGKKVKRLHQLSIETTDSKLRTVIVDNLPDDCSEKNIRSIFGKLGKILKITLHNPHLHHKSANNRTSGIIINSKTYALIEYGTAEAAASAITYFNHEDNWRSGMRVELQLTRMGKHGLALKGLKRTYEKKSSAHVEEPNAIQEKISIANHEMLALKEASRAKVLQGIGIKVEEEVELNRTSAVMLELNNFNKMAIHLRTSLYNGQGCRTEQEVLLSDGANLKPNLHDARVFERLHDIKIPSFL
ncbi:la-related protein 6B-like isoform X1 [Zingiber officinale]|uniref:la-related protein 6B-like isoform X1 n=1 Tax=Zingiber officinale TaxID=94328 RepID=UPI001C4B8B3A|nr:la-related protein 6B-like isoform X1 [Zingiber officinale]